MEQKHNETLEKQIRILYDLKEDRVTLEVANCDTSDIATAVANIIHRVSHMLLVNGVSESEVNQKIVLACSLGLANGTSKTADAKGGSGGGNEEQH